LESTYQTSTKPATVMYFRQNTY